MMCVIISRNNFHQTYEIHYDVTFVEVGTKQTNLETRSVDQGISAAPRYHDAVCHTFDL